MVTFSQLACHLRYALIIVCVLVIVILFSKWTGSSSNENVTILRERSTTLAANRADITKNLVFNAKQIYENASHQLLASPTPTEEQRTFLVMQLAYALAYVDSAQMICTDLLEIEHISGMHNLTTLIANISTLQRQLVQHVQHGHLVSSG